MAARPEHVSRDFVLLDLRRIPGATHERALSHQGRPQRPPRAYAQRLRRRRRPRAHRGHGKLSARGRLNCGPRGPCAIHGRDKENREKREKRIATSRVANGEKSHYHHSPLATRYSPLITRPLAYPHHQ